MWYFLEGRRIGQATAIRCCRSICCSSLSLYIKNYYIYYAKIQSITDFSQFCYKFQSSLFHYFSSQNKMFLLRIVLTAILVCVSQCKLYQAFAVFRHGARHHKLPIYEEDLTSGMWYQLTPMGFRMLENLGSSFRKHYIEKLNLLSGKYNSSEFEIYATQLTRTIQSAVSFSYGLYPPGSGAKLPNVNPTFHLPPYPTNHTDIQQQTFALPNGHQIISVKFGHQIVLRDCSNWYDLVDQSIQARKAEYQDMNLRYTPFLKKIAPILLKNSTKPINVDLSRDIFDLLQVDRNLNKPLPSGITEADFKNLEHLTTWYYTFMMSNRLAHLINTFKLKKVINECEKRIYQPTTHPTRLTVFSGHDTDIGALFTDLNISSGRCVDDIYRQGKTDELNCEVNVGFASNVVIELHSDDEKEFYVMVRANGKYVYLCEKQSYKCPFFQFRNRVKSVLLDNPEDYCIK